MELLNNFVAVSQHTPDVHWVMGSQVAVLALQVQLLCRIYVLHAAPNDTGAIRRARCRRTGASIVSLLLVEIVVLTFILWRGVGAFNGVLEQLSICVTAHA